MSLKFTIEQRLAGSLGRAGLIETRHGVIETPAFVVVGTKATVKALSPEQVAGLGTQVVLANTYHLYLEPGEELVEKAGGLGRFMNWPGPTMTDSGGFQVFSLGSGYDSGFNKFISREELASEPVSRRAKTAKFAGSEGAPAKVDEEGVSFRSPLDGQTHRLTPETSIQIQHALGADIIFAFDECTSPTDPYDYQKGAMERTHRWAERSLAEHQRLISAKPEKFSSLHPQAGSDANKNFPISPSLFGIVQGGNFRDLREASAKFLAARDFDGYGIGGSYTKEEISEVLAWVNVILPAEKPRHLLGIGSVEDFFIGVENGVETFDCVAPSREGRNGTLETATGRINILNAQYRDDLRPIEAGCACYTCQHYSRAYLAHLYRAKEMLAGTLGTIHNLYFAVNLLKQIRQAILDGNFESFKSNFLNVYRKGNSFDKISK